MTAKVHTNTELIQEVANRAGRWGMRKGLQGGAVAGSRKHAYADRLLTRYQRMYGDRGLTTEVSYSRGQAGLHGKGSIRLDVVEGPLNNPAAIYDYKFGTAQLTPSRIDRIRRIGEFIDSVPIIPVRPQQ
jgi:hypothetical protein